MSSDDRLHAAVEFAQLEWDKPTGFQTPIGRATAARDNWEARDGLEDWLRENSEGLSKNHQTFIIRALFSGSNLPKERKGKWRKFTDLNAEDRMCSIAGELVEHFGYNLTRNEATNEVASAASILAGVKGIGKVERTIEGIFRRRDLNSILIENRELLARRT